MPKPIHPPTPELQFEAETSLLLRDLMRAKLEHCPQCRVLSLPDREWLCRYLSQRVRHQDANFAFHRQRFRESPLFLRNFAERLAGSIIEGFLATPKGYKTLVHDLEPNQP